MRQSLDLLRGRAEKAAKFRGHRIRWTAAYHGRTSSNQQGDCCNCPAWVDIDTDPPANGIDIGGPAVALDCPAVPEEG